MNRNCYFDLNLKEIILKNIPDSDSFFGLLIGQRLAEKDYIYHSISTNANFDLKEYINKQDQLFKKIEFNLINQYNQISYMLIGGVDVVGLYINVSKLQNQNYHIALKSILLSLFKNVEIESKVPNCFYGLILEITDNKKFFGKYYDVTNKQYSGQSIEVTFSDHLSSFISLQCYISLDNISYINSLFNIQNRKNFSKDSLSYTIKNLLDDKILMINDDLCFDTEELIENKLSKVSSISLVKDMTKSINTDSKIRTCDTYILTKGSMHCKALIHRKCTIGDAIKALINDANHSLMSRYKIISLGMETSEENIDDCDNNLYELPKRVYANYDDDTLPSIFCDYLLQEETEDDGLCRFAQLQTIQPTIESNLEAFQDIEIEEEFVENFATHHQMPSTERNSKFDQNKLIGLSIIILIVAVLIIYSTNLIN